MRVLFAVLVLAVALSDAAPASAADPWTMTEITGPGVTLIHPEAVNNHGVVVGKAAFPGKSGYRAFRWADGVMEELPAPANALSSLAFDINDKGVIVGSYQYDINPNDQYNNDAPKGLRWEGGGYTELPCCFDGVSPPAAGGAGSVGQGINEDNIITGTAWSGQDINPFKWSGGYMNLSPAGQEATGAWGSDINEHGVVAGYINIAPSDRGAVYKDGVRTIIALDPGENGLNDLGHVVGDRAYQDGKKEIAQLWDGTNYVSLAPESSYSKANAVNNSDWAVGRQGIQDYQPGGGTAMLWRPGLPAATVASLIGGGYNLEQATDINDDGAIVGRGFRQSTQIGYMVVPAGLAYQLTGTVTDGAGTVLPNVPIRVLNAAGDSMGEPIKTNAEGKYTWTLPRGEYRVTAMPEGGYGVVATPDCTIVTFHCDISVTRNRTVDFQAVAATPQPVPTATPPALTTSPGPSVKPDILGPAFTLALKKLKFDKKGVAQFPLPAFAEAVTGSIVLKSGKTVIAKATFAVPKGKASKVKLKLNKKGRKLLKRKRRAKATVAVTALDVIGNPTPKTLKLTLTR
jgi:probable HAF family extracellular repeat protein